MTEQELKKQMLDVIKRRTARGVGVRTTEVEDVWREASGFKKPNSGYNDGTPEAKNYYDKFPQPRNLPANLVRELNAESKLKWFSGGGYCWMVPTGYEGHIGIKGSYVNQPHDLW